MLLEQLDLVEKHLQEQENRLKDLLVEVTEE